MGGSGRRVGVCGGSSGVGMGGYGPWVSGTVGGVEESRLRLLEFPFLGGLGRAAAACSLPGPGSPLSWVPVAKRVSDCCAACRLIRYCWGRWRAVWLGGRRGGRGRGGVRGNRLWEVGR